MEMNIKSDLNSGLEDIEADIELSFTLQDLGYEKVRIERDGGSDIECAINDDGVTCQ